MNPLPSRLKSSNPRVDESIDTASASKSIDSPVRTRGHPRITEAGLLELAYGIPSLHASNSSLNAEPTPKHGRSMSNPFPSLFQSRQKRQGVNALGTSDLSDGDAHSQTPNGAFRAAAKSAGISDKTLVTGKCMTCDSTVRWPKELYVFRCTVCLTINDLKPISTTTKGKEVQGSHGFSETSTREILPSFSRIKPLSTVRTGALIEQCIVEYLLDRLGVECGESQTLPEKLDDPYEAPFLSESISRSLPTKTCHRLSEVERGIASGAIVDDSDRNARIRRYNDEPDGSPYIYSSSKTSKQNANAQLTPDESRNSKHLRTSNSEKVTQLQSRGVRDIFKPLEDYVITSFMSRDCVNNSFPVLTPIMAQRAASEGGKQACEMSSVDRPCLSSATLSEIDAKTLLIGNFAENGAWWTGKRDPLKIQEMRRLPYKNLATELPNWEATLVSHQSPGIDWIELSDWYDQVLQSGTNWKQYLHGLIECGRIKLKAGGLSSKDMAEIEHEMLEAQVHTQRVLLKATESLLKRPGKPLRRPDDVRFLLIILGNPLLYPSHVPISRKHHNSFRPSSKKPWYADFSMDTSFGPARTDKGYSTLSGTSHGHDNGPGQHSGIIKRVLGLLSNLPNDCHHHLVAWFARYSQSHFQKTTELVGSFVTYRLSRQQEKHQITKHSDADFIPDAHTAGPGTVAALHVALNLSGQHSKNSGKRPRPMYNDDWQIRAAARVMALLFSANNQPRRNVDILSPESTLNSISSSIRTNLNHRGNHGQILAISSFYNTLLDYSDLVADFEAWEIGGCKFSFCQYPFFLSIWAKIQIMEHDARRQMELKAREAFFDSIMTRKTVNQYLVLTIRRECLVEDSLKGVSEVVGSSGEEIKKGLRIEFRGEEGVDAGGLRKEWFLLLVRDLFNPEHGMFVYDEDSHFCYFNPNSFETSDQYFLVGVVLGLAIYNSTILDVALPPFAFRKLLAAGPTAAPGAPSHAKPNMTYCLEDLAELRPALANGLRQLLDFDGNVEDTFCRDFVAEVERYGQVTQIPLCPNGGKTPVTNANRREFVDLYVRYLLDTAVARQFEPFKRGFFTICGGNALSLFHPEEIELLIRGSDEPLDIESLQAVAIYENWGVPTAAETEPVIEWFWHTFQGVNPKDQRKLLGFITGSDRIPAMGAASLVIKLSCLGDDSPRFPVARTCFNSLSLWRYNSRQKLESMLWRAVYESEGFGLK